VRDNGHSSRVYLDGGLGQDLRDPRPDSVRLVPERETPFCLGIVGDFSGRGSRPEEDSHRDIPQRRLHRVTPDNLLTYAGLSPRIVVPGTEGLLPETEIRFSDLEDFHPDQLFRRLDVFRRLREAGERIRAGESPASIEPDPRHKEPDPGSRESDPSSREPDPDSRETDLGPGKPNAGDPGSGEINPGEANLLDAVLGETERDTDRREGKSQASPPPGSPLNEDLDDFLRRIIEPHAVKPAPDQSELMEDLDREANRLMRAVMLDPAFRELESLWRGVVFLLSHIQVSTNLRVYLIDMSEGELVADLLSTDDPTEWGFAHPLLNPISETGEELRWTALLGCFRFGSDPLHAPLLQRIGLLCESGDVPWFAEADPALLGAASLKESPEPRDWEQNLDPLWEDLRERPEAKWVSLSLPGFLLRPPYGPGGKKVKGFPFRESADLDGPWLWGNPALLMAVALARDFARSGWGMRLSGRYSVSQLPTHATADDGVSCLQAHFSHSGAAGALDRGLNPVVGPRNEAEAHFAAPVAISGSGTVVRAWWRDPA